MPSAERLDFAALLAPISDDAPAGPDLREDPSPTAPYRQIKDARQAALRAEREIVDEDAPSVTALWRPVIDLAPSTLATGSKNLDVTAWLIQALVRVHGFAGIRDGYRLVRELCETFWDTVYPLPDEDGFEGRVAQLAGLNGLETDGPLVKAINQIVITEGQSVGPFALWEYRQAQEIERITDPEAKERRVSGGGISMEKFKIAVSESSLEFFVTLRDDARAALESFETCTAVLDERCGGESPPSSYIRNALRDALGVVEAICAEVIPEPVEDEVEAIGDGASGDGEGGGGGTPGALKSREDAFRMLAKVAEYFRRAEPHSPVSYALEQAVRWGRMPLPDLWAELIPDSSAREELFKVTGIRSEDT